MKVIRLLYVVTGIFCFVLLLNGSTTGYRAAGAATDFSHLRKIVAPYGTLAPDGVDVHLWQEYDSFALYGLTENGLTRLTDEQRRYLQPAEAVDTILFDGYPFNPVRDLLSLPASLRLENPSGTGLQVIQFVGPIKEEWLKIVAATGSSPITYIANNAYLVWTDSLGRGQLDALAAQSSFMQFSMPYHPFFKLSAPLRDLILSAEAPDSSVTVTVQLYQHPGVAESESFIRQVSQKQITPWYSLLHYQNSTITLRLADLISVARLPDVVTIGQAINIELLDEVQGQILAGNLDGSQTGPAGPGYLAWLNSYGFSTNPADYPIIDITDGGVGNGTIDSGDPTLHQFGNVANPSRLAYIANCTADATGGDVGGHGHLNASIAGGYDQRGGFPFEDGAGFQYGLGINPYGRLASTRMFIAGGDLSNCFNDFGYLIWQSYQNGARISSNSWGCNDESTACLSSYTVTTQLYDAATRDADTVVPGNQELIFVFGAGNNSSGGSINTPANGKNVITVGASESDRPSEIDGCGLGTATADNIMDIAPFSSRGPAPGGRVKPEIVAPGTHIQGTTPTNFDGTAVCGGPGNHGLFGSGLNPYYPANQTIFSWASGTSHATPAISGAASLYYYWLENNYGLSEPSPALIKAYLLTHTRYLTGQDANDTFPSNSQGYGLPDMDVALSDTPRHLVDQAIVFDASGETWTFNTSVADPSKPIRIVLAYTDQPGLVGTSPQVNDLNLQVALNGETYWGNQFNSQWSASGGTADTLNNYEAVFLPPGTVGDVTVTVTAFNIAGDGVPGYGDTTDQDFAFVCYNCAEAPDFTLQAAPTDLTVCAPDSAVYSVQMKGFGGFSGNANLSVSGQPAGATAVFSPGSISPGSSSILTLSNIGAVAPGSYKLLITGTAPGRSHSTTVWLHLAESELPGAVELLLPAEGATDVGVSAPTFNWLTTTPSDTYSFQLATDENFENVVYQTVVAGTSFTLDGRLSLATRYFWRVQTGQACGQSQSLVGSFTTAVTMPLLLIDDDNNDGILFADVQTQFTSALDDLNIPFDIWQVGVDGSDPSSEILRQYEAVVWFTGDTPAGPSPDGEAALSSFLDGERCLLLSSEGYHKTWGLTSFMSEYLGVEQINDDVNYKEITGTGPIFGAIGTIALDDNTLWSAPAAITPDGTAEAAFLFDTGIAGISKESGSFRTAYLGFGLEDAALNHRIQILGAFLNWCGLLPDAPSATGYLFLPLVIKP